MTAHKDESLRDQLAIHLAPLKQNGLVVEWHDRKIQAGMDWDKEIASRLDSADLVIALVSPDFLASDCCFGMEMERIFVRLKQGEATVRPILLRPCLWEESRFSALQTVPRDAKPVTAWHSTDEALLAVSQDIVKAVSAPKPGPAQRDADRAAEPVFESSVNLVPH